jgi:diacylglycerol kinase
MSKKYRTKNIIQKIGVGFNGLKFAFKSEPTLSIQISVGLITTISIIILGGNWWFVKQTIFLTIAVIMFELINTSFEYLCDLVEMKKSSKVKKVKDISAGLVLIASLIAIIITLIDFIKLVL